MELKEIETLWEVGFRERVEVVSYYLEKERGGGCFVFGARVRSGGRNRKREFFLDLTMEKREEGGGMKEIAVYDLPNFILIFFDWFGFMFIYTVGSTFVWLPSFKFCGSPCPGPHEVARFFHFLSFFNHFFFNLLSLTIIYSSADFELFESTVIIIKIIFYTK